MAIQLSGNTVITDSRELRKITSTNTDTNTVLADAMRQDDEYIQILDSSGNEIHRVWGASESLCG